MQKRSAIALMITLLFIVGITAALTLSLSYVNRSNQKIQESRFLIQCNSVVEDILKFLKESPDVKQIKDAESFNFLLLTAGMIPLEYQSLRVFIEIKSARGKFNINSLATSQKLRDSFINYLARYNIADATYVTALLVDSTRGGMNDSSVLYESDIFDEKMWLYRDKIASQKQLHEILDFYVKNRHDPAIYEVPWEDLVRFGDKNDTKLDVNYMTSDVWQMCVPTLEVDAAEEMADHFAVFTKFGDLGLAKEEYRDLKEIYKGTFYEPIVEVNIDVEDRNSTAKIKFEYDLKKKKANNFEFHI